MAQGHFTMGLGIIFRIWNPLKPSFNSPSFISYIYIIIYIYIYIMCIYIYYIMYIYISHVWLEQTPGKHPIYCDPCWSTSYFSWGAQTPQTSGLVLDQWDLFIFGASQNLWILTLGGPDAHATRRHRIADPSSWSWLRWSLPHVPRRPAAGDGETVGGRRKTSRSARTTKTLYCLVNLATRNPHFGEGESWIRIKEREGNLGTRPKHLSSGLSVVNKCFFGSHHSAPPNATNAPG